MSEKTESADSIGNALERLTETEHEQQQLRQEANDFAARFLARQRQPAEAHAVASRHAEKSNSKDPLSNKINDLYMRMVDLAVCEGDLLRSGERRYFLPFIATNPASKEMLVKVVPFASPELINSQQELSSGISLMRGIDDFLHDTASVHPQAFPHIREILKALFVFIHGQLHHGKKLDNSLEIDFPRALKMLEALKFNPAESMRDLYYEKFKKLMEGKGIVFDAKTSDLQQWIKDENGDPDPGRAKIGKLFERDLESKTLKLKGELIEHLKMLADTSKETTIDQTKSISDDFSRKVENLVK